MSNKVTADVTLGWQEKSYSPTEEAFYMAAKEEDFHSNVLRKKFFRDVHDANKRRRQLGQKIFTCLDGELYEDDEVSIKNLWNRAAPISENQTGLGK